MILEDVTGIVCGACDELSIDSKTSLASLRFSLLDSMSAVELLDPKMDQCCALYETFHKQKYFSTIFSNVFDTEMDVRKTAAILLLHFENELAFLSGDSLMESTHTSIFVWSQTWREFIDIEPFTNRCILLSAKSLVLSLDSIFSTVLAADIYEDEDFSPSFRGHLGCEGINNREIAENIDSLKLEILNSQLLPNEKEMFISLLSLRNLITELFVTLNRLVTSCVTSATSRLRLKSHSNEQVDIKELLNKSHVKDFRDACEKTLKFVSQLLSTSQFLDGIVTVPKLSEVLSSVSSLFLSGPKRKSSKVGFTESLNMLSSIISGFLGAMDTFFPLISGNEEFYFEDIILLLCEKSANCEHLLVRSLLCGLLHCVGVNMNKFFSFRRLLSQEMVTSALVLEWIGGNLSLTAWETIKLLCSNRRKIFARFSSLFSNWGVISSEALYVDEQLHSMASNPTSFSQVCTCWVTVVVTKLMDLYMRLMSESNILETSEMGYFYWYWDYILSVNAHARDKLRLIDSSSNISVVSKYDELFSRAEGFLARSSFRLFLFKQKFCILNGRTLKYTQAETIYNERFRVFHNIPNPTPLTYNDYLHSINSFSEDRVGSQQLLTSISICLENAKKLLIDARHSNNHLKRNESIVNSLKCVLTLIINVKKLQEVTSQSKGWKILDLHVSDREYFPKLQVEI